MASNAMFTNMIVKEGIKRFCEVVIAAGIKELKKIDEGSVPGKPVVIPMETKLLTQN